MMYVGSEVGGVFGVVCLGWMVDGGIEMVVCVKLFV